MNIVRPFDSSTGADDTGGDREEPLLSVSDAALALRVGPATVRRYLSDFRGFVETQGERRELKIVLRSFPVLARIRDMRARRMRKGEIECCLADGPYEDANGTVQETNQSATPAVPATDAALDSLRREFAALKQELRENELVMRQSLSTILFLMEKHSKELEFHVSEERLANRERDFLLARGKAEPDVPQRRQERRASLIASLLSLFPTVASSSR